MRYADKYKQFYNSRDWKNIREQVLCDHEFLCQDCKKNGKIKMGNQVHHIEPIQDNWNKRLDYDNLIVLCAECHNKRHERNSGLEDFIQEWQS